ncbi:MAG: hypothetical protein EA405_15415 [Rhodospirillales bacterium]|nr:MAG: hypothetical protein EA405_15415 [Rhodospirillales bacterium]
MSQNLESERLVLGVRPEVVCIFLIILISLSLFRAVAIGHIASDDMSYIVAARGWLDQEAFVPQSHWTVRHTVTLPMALSFWLFGDGEWQSVLPSLLYSLALVSSVFLIMCRYFGIVAALFGSAALVSTGLYSEIGTGANADVAEALFVLLGLYIFYDSATRKNGRTSRLFAAGLLIGLALLTRETAAAVVATLVLLFLFGSYTARWRYLVVGLGFLVPLVVESLYYVAVGEGAFHRFETVMATAGGPELTIAGDVREGTGNITDNRLIGPFAALLINNEFGLIFWFASAAGIAFLWNRRAQDGHEYGFLWLLMWASLVWVGFLFYILGLRPLPRYMVVPLVTAAFMIGPWLAGLFRNVVRRRLSIALLVMLVLAGLLGIDLSNKSPRHPERLLAEWADKYREPVHAEPEFVRRAYNFLRWKGVSPDSVRTEAPNPGDLYALRLERRDAVSDSTDMRAVDLENAEALDSWDGNRTLTGRLLGLVGVDERLRDTPLFRLVQYGEPARLVRIVGEKDG